MRVHLFEVFLVSRLATEGLDDADTADVLGQRRGDQAEPACARRGGPGMTGSGKWRSRSPSRHHQPEGERQALSRKKQDDRRPDERERALDERRHAVGDELVERIDVVRQPR